MAHCWEEYMWKVHKAVPVDPWATNVQLLDVLIPDSPPPPLSWLLHKQKLPSLSRAGSMLSLASKDSCKPKVVANASADDGNANNESPIEQLDSNVDGDATLTQQIDNNNRSSTDVAHHGPSDINSADSDTSERPQLQTDSINGHTSTHSQRILTEADRNTTSGFLLPDISDTSNDARHPAQLIKSGSVNQLLNKSKTPIMNTAGPTRVNNMINREMPAQAKHIHKKTDSSTEPIIKTFLIRASGMPDIQASIRSSTSLLASFTGGSSSGTAQFDVKGSKTVTCNVGGVESQHVDLDAFMELVTPRMTSGDCSVALWQPDMSLPQLQVSPKRGQTIWVVTEILYANMIKIEGDNQAQANSKANVLKGAGVEVSKQVGVENEGVWKVTAAKGSPTFPFAVRLQRLKYDANGSLVVSNKNLRRN